MLHVGKMGLMAHYVASKVAAPSKWCRYSRVKVDIRAIWYSLQQHQKARNPWPYNPHINMHPPNFTVLGLLHTFFVFTVRAL